MSTQTSAPAPVVAPAIAPAVGPGLGRRAAVCATRRGPAHRRTPRGTAERHAEESARSPMSPSQVRLRGPGPAPALSSSREGAGMEWVGVGFLAVLVGFAFVALLLESR